MERAETADAIAFRRETARLKARWLAAKSLKARSLARLIA
jgi:hypothetical protein